MEMPTNQTNTVALQKAEQVEIDVNEAKRIIASQSLSSFNLGDFLVITNSNFDVTISGQPYLALMLLYSLNSGKYIARIWNQTVAIGWAFKNNELDEACEDLFGQGMPCIGYPTKQHYKDDILQDVLLSHTPIPRVVSKSCHKFLGKYNMSDCLSCTECQKLGALEESDHEKTSWEDAMKIEEEHGEDIEVKKEDFEDDWSQDSKELYESGEGILSTEPTAELPKIVKQEANILTNTPTDNIVGPSKANKIQENKPPLTYTQLIEQALMTEKDLGLPVSKIFSFISQKYPFYKMKGKKGWQHGITQALSAKGQFEKVSNPNGGKISLWRIMPGKATFPDKSREKTCPYCDKVTTTLYEHRVFVHHYGKFQCPTCHSQFNFAKDVVEHMKMEAHFGEVHCCECKKDYPMAEIESHYVICATGCATCNKTFKHKNGVKLHRMHAHKEEQDGDKKRSHCCEKCGKQFKHLASMRTHIYRIHEDWGRKGSNEPFLCSTCGMNFKTYGLMSRHKVKVHFREKHERQCQKCGLRFSNPSLLKTHLRTHEPPQFKCSFCGKMIMSKRNLVSHERVHRGEKPFQCTLCSASFAGGPLLSQHMRGAHKIVGPQGGKVGWVHGKKQKQDDT